MARGHRLNTSIVLAAVHGLSGLFRAVSAVKPSLFGPLHPTPTPLSPSLISHLASVVVKQNGLGPSEQFCFAPCTYAYSWRQLAGGDRDRSARDGLTGTVLCGRDGLTGTVLCGRDGLTGTVLCGRAGLTGTVLCGRDGLTGTVLCGRDGLTGTVLCGRDGLTGTVLCGRDGLTGTVLCGRDGHVERVVAESEFVWEG